MGALYRAVGVVVIDIAIVADAGIAGHLYAAQVASSSPKIQSMQSAEKGALIDLTSHMVVGTAGGIAGAALVTEATE